MEGVKEAPNLSLQRALDCVIQWFLQNYVSGAVMAFEETIKTLSG